MLPPQTQTEMPRAARWDGQRRGTSFADLIGDRLLHAEPPAGDWQRWTTLTRGKGRPSPRDPSLGAAFGLALLAAATATGSDTVHSLFNLGGLVIVFGGVTAVAFMSFQPDDVCKAMGSIVAMLKGVAPGGPESDLRRDMEDIVGWSRIVHERARAASSAAWPGTTRPIRC